MKPFALSRPTCVRLSNDLHARILNVAKRFEVSESDIIRLAVKRTLPEWEKYSVDFLPTKPRKKK